jgi:hypothetical protein
MNRKGKIMANKPEILDTFSTTTRGRKVDEKFYTDWAKQIETLKKAGHAGKVAAFNDVATVNSVRNKLVKYFDWDVKARQVNPETKTGRLEVLIPS